MLKIWGRPNSINVQKVMWTVNELDLEYEHEVAGMAHGKVGEPWYRSMNPNGLVPTIDDDGVVLWESNVVVRYLAAKHATGTMMPATNARRAEAEMWMDWQQTTILPGITPVFWNIIRTPPSGPDQSAIDAGCNKMRTSFAMLDARLAGRDYVLGDEFTVADVPIGCATYRWYALPVEHGDFPNVRAWYERLAARPAYQKHVMMPLT
ncbi:MAG: glutathione S-transferase family protein [Alphaproteobacteria bacterium]|nr:glutathione S-transferase family protein [Alphaproteobacteria bacterium]